MRDPRADLHRDCRGAADRLAHEIGEIHGARLERDRVEVRQVVADDAEFLLIGR
jgi:hypothetical protein